MDESVRQAVNVGNALHNTGATQFSFSSSGSLAYVPGGIFGVHEATLVWVDLNGDSQPLPAPPLPYFMPRLSPDGQKVAVTTGGLNVDIWMYDISRRSMTRLTTDKSIERIPIWTPDGTRIAFASDRGGQHCFYWMPTDGSGSPERLTTTIEPAAPASWSPDGQVLAFAQSTTDSFDISVLRLEGEPAALYSVAVRRTVSDVFARWPLVSLCLESVGANGGLRYSLPWTRAETSYFNGRR